MPTEDLAFRYPYDGPYNSFDSRKRSVVAATLSMGSQEQQQQQLQQQQQQQQQGPDQSIDSDGALASAAATKSVLRSVSGLAV